MIFNSLGLPRDNGASDWMDSSRLAGLMALFKHPKAPTIALYFTDKGPVRCPNMGDDGYYHNKLEYDPKDFSRDQATCLAAGFWRQEKEGLYREMFNGELVGWRAPNGDLLSPSVMNHFKLCADRKGSWLGYKFLELDIWYNAKFTPMREPNQLIALCMVAGPKYVRMYKRSCDWKAAIREYWALSYRKEEEFAEFLINELSVI